MHDRKDNRREGTIQDVTIATIDCYPTTCLKKEKDVNTFKRHPLQFRQKDEFTKKFYSVFVYQLVFLLYRNRNIT
ncbi:hypothetical protein CEXT_590421 [Caerostris extrusa]|uniref:Uncharacterized protein n=1 Tax=Caerostris extrusa TaxID=172846 RepID=A0AAV4SSZ9_CAEEX|nr:hypothetical protein CEXT_590421 [Caerostris extrusa]